MNIELFERIKLAIREDPRRIDMEVWGQQLDPQFASSNEWAPACGTVACIAGWACVLTGHRPHEMAVQEIIGTALQELGFPNGPALTLFSVDSWPETMRNRYMGAPIKRERAEAACEAIDAFVAGGGRFAS